MLKTLRWTSTIPASIAPGNYIIRVCDLHPHQRENAHVTCSTTFWRFTKQTLPNSTQNAPSSPLAGVGVHHLQVPTSRACLVLSKCQTLGLLSTSTPQLRVPILSLAHQYGAGTAPLPHHHPRLSDHQYPAIPQSRASFLPLPPPPPLPRVLPSVSLDNGKSFSSSLL